MLKMKNTSERANERDTKYHFLFNFGNDLLFIFDRVQH